MTRADDARLNELQASLERDERRLQIELDNIRQAREHLQLCRRTLSLKKSPMKGQA